MYVDTEEKYNIVFAHQDELIRKSDPTWISVHKSLPAVDTWVSLLENDRLNGQDEYWSRHFKRPFIRVGTAMLHYTDEEDNAYWYRGYVGRSPISYGRNVSHWMPQPRTPDIEEYPEE